MGMVTKLTPTIKTKSRRIQTRIKKTLALKELAKCGQITKACKIAGVNRAVFYEWEHKDPKFAAAIKEALKLAKQTLTEELIAAARKRAVKGVKKPTGWYQGKPGGYIREYSDNLLMFLLKGEEPMKYRDRYEQVNPPPPATLQINVGVALQSLCDNPLIERLLGSIDALPSPNPSSASQG